MVTIERLDPGHAALVLVDVQNDFCHPEGSASRAGFDVTRVDRAVDRLVEVVDAARGVQVPVIFVRTTHDGLVDSAEWTHRTADGVGMGQHTSPPNCVTGTWGAEFYRVVPVPGEPVVTKHRYSAFAGTDLGMILRTLARRSVVFAGYTTNVCVETSLRDGLCRDYLVSIVGDACAAFEVAEHDASLKTIARYFGQVFDADAVVARWSAGA